MKDYSLKYISTIRLNSFHPLCENEIGRNAVKNGFKPFIDASCRREPDFENPNPSITCLCRQEMFAPHLIPNDIVVYITVKGKWLTDFNHYRLIAILKVVEHKESHHQAKYWYTNQNIAIPSNCMVDDNPPHPFHETASDYETEKEIKNYLKHPEEKQKIIGDRRVKLWDGRYLDKSKKWGSFIITKPIFVNVTDPPILTDDSMKQIFGKVPNTRNPNKITKEQFKKLARFADVNIIS